ncbi:AAA family ATPase [Cryobacterium sp. BB307]|uniref:AAA family ATPase n=1 Tax=Cryobacterium sp. BB307 TaxID=2716317 RepID=UPI00144759EE|nr:AAA family ATPase [Cryobacterium sp. BB307]
MTPKIGHVTRTASQVERFHFAPLDDPTAPQCLAPKSGTHKPDTCTERGKHPIGSHVRRASNDPGLVRKWRAEGYNLGVVCGPSGVVILDEDTLGDFERFCRDKGVEVPVTYKVRSAKGWHYYFAEPEGVHFGNRSPFKKAGYNLDVRGGNAYAVAAGSVHATGVIYTAEDDDAVVAVMPEWLVSYLSTPAPRQVKEEAPEAVAAYAGDDAYSGGTHYERASVNGCIARLQAMHGPWSEGAGWDEGTFSQACSLLELANVPFFELTAAEAEALVREHAPTDEAWGIEQVGAKIASARQTVGDRKRMDLPIDVVAEAVAQVAPDLSDLEDQVWGYHRNGYSRKPPERHAVKLAIRSAWNNREKPPTVSTGGNSKRTLNLVNLADVEFEVTEWAWDEVIPLGILTGIAGWAGIGKSTLISWLVAGLTRGKFEGDLKGQPASVLIVAGEDDTSRQLAPRLNVAGADMNRVSVVQPAIEVVQGQSVDTVMQLTKDLPTIRQMLIDTDAKMLVLDPILSFVDGDPNGQKDVRNALDPLAALARELNIAVVVVMHFKKGHGVAGEKVSGSHVWRDALRSLLVMAVDEESQYRVVTIDKSNYSNARGKSMLFEVTGAVVQGRDTKGKTRNQFVSKAQYIGDSPRSVQDLLEAENAKRDGRRVVNEDTAETIAWICDQPGPVTWSAIARQVGVDPNAKEGPAKQERTNLMKKLSRAVARGDISKTGKGLYSKPTGLQPIPGLGGQEDY